MKTFAIITGILGTIILFVGMWFLGSYNSMVAGNENVEAQWAQVETQYERRFALIPNLVGSVQGILIQEQKVFGDIADARTHYASAKQGTQEEQKEAFGQYESAIGRLMVIMENYPQLKSYTQVQALMDELAGTENRILIARDRYNKEVLNWNVSIKRFPRSLLAQTFGFETRAFFEVTSGAEETPVVQLNTNVEVK